MRTQRLIKDPHTSWEPSKLQANRIRRLNPSTAQPLPSQIFCAFYPSPYFIHEHHPPTPETSKAKPGSHWGYCIRLGQRLYRTRCKPSVGSSLPGLVKQSVKCSVSFPFPFSRSPCCNGPSTGELASKAELTVPCHQR